MAEERERQAAVKKRIREIDREAGNLTQLLRNYEVSHPIATGNLMGRSGKARQEKRGLESRCSALDDDVAETMTFATEPEAIIEAAMDLRTYLEADDTSIARKFLRGFIKQVDVAHGTATIHCSLPLPNTQETESGYSTTVSLDDGEFLLEHRSPAHAGMTTVKSAHACIGGLGKPARQLANRAQRQTGRRAPDHRPGFHRLRDLRTGQGRERHHSYAGKRGYHPLLAVAAGTGDVFDVSTA